MQHRLLYIRFGRAPELRRKVYYTYIYVGGHGKKEEEKKSPYTLYN